jgi:hypothetical protein
MKGKDCDLFGNIIYIYDVVDIAWKYDLGQL